MFITWPRPRIICKARQEKTTYPMYRSLYLRFTVYEERNSFNAIYVQLTTTEQYSLLKLSFFSPKSIEEFCSHCVVRKSHFFRFMVRIFLLKQIQEITAGEQLDLGFTEINK